jgi:hypothetical protein
MPGSAHPDDKVTIGLTQGADGHIQRFYSIVATVNGRPISEALWDQGDPEHETRRDWMHCREISGEPPEEIPRTIQEALDSIAGPKSPPKEAIRIAPDTWRVNQGRTVMTVREIGTRQTDRIITVGLPSNPMSGTTIDEITLGLSDAAIALRAGWGTCRNNGDLPDFP